MKDRVAPVRASDKFI